MMVEPMPGGQLQNQICVTMSKAWGFPPVSKMTKRIDIYDISC